MRVPLAEMSTAGRDHRAEQLGRGWRIHGSIIRRRARELLLVIGGAGLGGRVHGRVGARKRYCPEGPEWKDLRSGPGVRGAQWSDHLGGFRGVHSGRGKLAGADGTRDDAEQYRGRGLLGHRPGAHLPRGRPGPRSRSVQGRGPLRRGRRWHPSPPRAAGSRPPSARDRRPVCTPADDGDAYPGPGATALDQGGRRARLRAHAPRAGPGQGGRLQLRGPVRLGERGGADGEHALERPPRPGRAPARRRGRRSG